MDPTGFWANTQPLLISFGLKLLGAIAIVVIGRWVIKFISKRVTKAMEKQKVEPTIVRGLDRGPGHRHRRGVGRPAVERRGGRVHPRAPAVQGR